MPAPPAVSYPQICNFRGTKLLVNDAAVADFFIVSACHNGAQVLVLVEAAQLAEGALGAKVLMTRPKGPVILILMG